MDKLARNKPIFIGLSCTAITCLVASFGYPLQKIEIYKQAEVGNFGSQYLDTFLISESDQDYPYGFNPKKAKKYAQIHRDAKWQKITLLILAGTSAITALGMSEICLHSEIDDEVSEVKAKGRKQLILEAVKHRLAMASKSQRLLFLDEMRVLMAEFGSAEEEIQEADEINALYSQTVETEEKVEGSAEEFRGTFPEQMDATVWKAVSKAEGTGASEEEIIQEVLSCDKRVGIKYLEFLRGKYGQ
jgi:hypothetical protein